MNPLETIVLVGVAVLMGGWLAAKLSVPAPLVQLALGVAAGFVPLVREIHLPSEAVLLLFLPALLFWEAFTTSLRDIRRDLRGILILSTLLVVASAFGVAGIGVLLGLSWGASLILGAALAPTDATAVGAMAKELPYRNMTILRAESLINDGTALVVYAIAVGAAVNHVVYTGWQVTGMVALAYLGGGAIGVAAGWLSTRVLRHTADPVVKNTALVVAPFAAFLAAELIQASGVIAVVVAGLLMSQTATKASTARSRQQAYSFWGLATSILNGALFVLIGIEAQSAVREVSAASIPALIGLTLLAWVGIILIRYAFQMTSVSLIRLLDRRPSQRTRRIPLRARTASALAGFRGAVSLAVALSVPASLAGRAEIIFITAGVVVLTLVVKGVALPPVVKWIHFAPDTVLDQELQLAQRSITEEGIRLIPELAQQLGVTDTVRERVLAEYRERLELINANGTEDEPVTEQDAQYTALRLALLEKKRDELIRLRDRSTISDTTRRAAQTRLDWQALRLTRPDLLE